MEDKQICNLFVLSDVNLPTNVDDVSSRFHDFHPRKNSR